MKQVTKPATEDVAWRQGSFILYHNHVKHDARTRRKWLPRMVLVTLSANHVVCDCGRCPDLGKRHRIDR
jgi:hypothetical protein